MKIEMCSSRELAARRWQHAGPILVMPFTDAVQAQRSTQLLSRRAGTDGMLLAVHDDARQGFIHITNQAFANSDSPFFGYLAQDAYGGREWLTQGMTGFKEASCKLLAFNDGKWFGLMAAFGLARRKWAAQVYDGPFFFPGYDRHYADAELSIIAAEQKGLKYAPQAVLVEVDWEKESRPVNAKDRSLFKARAAKGFEGRVKTAVLLARFG